MKITLLGTGTKAKASIQFPKCYQVSLPPQILHSSCYRLRKRLNVKKSLGNGPKRFFLTKFFLIRYNFNVILHL